VETGGEILLPGEVERRTLTERRANGIPVDPMTAKQIVDSAAALSVAAPPELAQLAADEGGSLNATRATARKQL
jgi:hypothetical protein